MEMTGSSYNFEKYFKVWVILELWNFDGLKLKLKLFQI